MLRKELERYKQNLFDNVSDISRFKNEIEKFFDEKQRQIEKNRQSIDELLKMQEMNFIFAQTSVLTFLLISMLFALKKEYELATEKKSFFEKLKEINDNFNLYKQIVNDYSFIKDEQLIAKKIFETKTLEEARERQEAFLKMMKEAINYINDNFKNNELSKEEKAIKVALNLALDDNLTRDNATLIRDYLNNEFETDFDLKQLKTIKLFAHNIVKNKENIKSFDNISIKNMKQQLIKMNEAERVL